MEKGKNWESIPEDLVRGVVKDVEEEKEEKSGDKTIELDRLEDELEKLENDFAILKDKKVEGKENIEKKKKQKKELKRDITQAKNAINVLRGNSPESVSDENIAEEELISDTKIQKSEIAQEKGDEGVDFREINRTLREFKDNEIELKIEKGGKDSFIITELPGSEYVVLKNVNDEGDVKTISRDDLCDLNPEETELRKVVREKIKEAEDAVVEKAVKEEKEDEQGKSFKYMSGAIGKEGAGIEVDEVIGDKGGGRIVEESEIVREKIITEDEKSIEEKWGKLENLIKNTVKVEDKEGSSIRDLFKEGGREKAEEHLKDGLEGIVKRRLEHFKLDPENEENFEKAKKMHLKMYDGLLDKIENEQEIEPEIQPEKTEEEKRREAENLKYKEIAGESRDKMWNQVTEINKEIADNPEMAGEDMEKTEDKRSKRTVRAVMADVGRGSYEETPKERGEWYKSAGEALNAALKEMQIKHEREKIKLTEARTKAVENFGIVSDEEIKRVVSEKNNQQAGESKKGWRGAYDYILKKLPKNKTEENEGDDEIKFKEMVVLEFLEVMGKGGLEEALEDKGLKDGGYVRMEDKDVETIAKRLFDKNKGNRDDLEKEIRKIKFRRSDFEGLVGKSGREIDLDEGAVDVMGDPLSSETGLNREIKELISEEGHDIDKVENKKDLMELLVSLHGYTSVVPLGGRPDGIASIDIGIYNYIRSTHDAAELSDLFLEMRDSAKTVEPQELREYYEKLIDKIEEMEEGEKKEIKEVFGQLDDDERNEIKDSFLKGGYPNQEVSSIWKRGSAYDFVQENKEIFRGVTFGQVVEILGEDKEGIIIEKVPAQERTKILEKIDSANRMKDLEEVAILTENIKQFDIMFDGSFKKDLREENYEKLGSDRDRDSDMGYANDGGHRYKKEILVKFFEKIHELCDNENKKNDEEDSGEGENEGEITDEMKGRIKEGFEKMKKSDKQAFLNVEGLSRAFSNSKKSLAEDFGEEYFERYYKDLNISSDNTKKIKTKDFMEVLKEIYEEVEVKEKKETEEITGEMKEKIREALVEMKISAKETFNNIGDSINNLYFPTDERPVLNIFNKGWFDDNMKNMGIKYEEIKDIKAKKFMEVLKEIYKEVKEGGEIKIEIEDEKDETVLETEETRSNFEKSVAEALNYQGGNRDKLIEILTKPEVEFNKKTTLVFLDVMEEEIKKVKNLKSLSKMITHGFDICQNLQIENQYLSSMMNSHPAFSGIRKALSEKIEELIDKGSISREDEIEFKFIGRSFLSLNENKKDISLDEMAKKLKK